MKDKKTEQEIKENEAWRKGFEMGLSEALRKNDAALQIGRAILNVLDNRYEFAKEDY